MSPISALVVGEALVDIIDRDGESSVRPGGSPMNVAIGLARLGIHSTLHATIGTDEYGTLVTDHLAASGVELTSTTLSDAPTSVARATLDASGAATYDFSIEWNPAPFTTDGFGLVHVGSIGAAMLPGADVVEAALREAADDALISFDPNVRPALMGPHAGAVERVERFVALSDVVKASDEDLEWLYPSVPIDEVLQRWVALGASLAVATRGADGALSVSSAGGVAVAAPSITVADTIGAGDSFMAGLLAAIVDGGTMDVAGLSEPEQQRVLTFAATCAAMTASRFGADPPTRAELG